MIENKELQPNISSTVEGLQPSLEAASFETEVTAVSPTQETKPTVDVKVSDVREIKPQAKKLSSEVNTFQATVFDINASTKESSTWLAILKAKRLREELPQ